MMGRAGGGVGGSKVPSVNTALLDDVLELSHRVVKGFVCRVTRAPLYIAFKLWAARARWVPGKDPGCFAGWLTPPVKKPAKMQRRCCVLLFINSSAHGGG